MQGQSTSSQSINSNVPRGQRAKTLLRLQENIYKMEKIINQIWKEVDSGGIKVTQAAKQHYGDQDSSASSSESKQDNPDEHRINTSVLIQMKMMILLV